MELPTVSENTKLHGTFLLHIRTDNLEPKAIVEYIQQHKMQAFYGLYEQMLTL
jgi:hypothetical protein